MWPVASFGIGSEYFLCIQRGNHVIEHTDARRGPEGRGSVGISPGRGGCRGTMEGPGTGYIPPGHPRELPQAASLFLLYVL